MRTPADHQLPGAAGDDHDISKLAIRCLSKTAMGKSASEGLQNFTNPLFFPSNPAARANRDGLNFASSPFEIVVDDGEIVAAIVEHFLPRALKAAPNFVFRILPAFPDAPFKIRAQTAATRKPRRHRATSLHLQRALHVDLENQILF